MAIGPCAEASYIATLNEVGGNVVGTGSGSLDFSELALVGTIGSASTYLQPVEAVLVMGSGDGAQYDGISGLGNFGSGGPVNADSETGALVGVGGGYTALEVPVGYISGTPLSVSSATWNNATFASLGVTPGTYVWPGAPGPDEIGRASCRERV